MNPLKSLALINFQQFHKIMGKEIRNISEEEWDDAFMLFKTGLTTGHIYLQAAPHDAEVAQLVNSMEYLLEGLGDIDVYGRALLYCAHSIEALSSCQRGLNQLSALPPGHEMADLMKGSILAILEEEAIGGLQTALQIKPDYTCAQETLQEAQAMLAKLQGKPDEIAMAKLYLAMLNPNHPVDQRIIHDLMAVIETGNPDLVQLVMSTSRTVDQLIDMLHQRQFQEGLSVAAKAILTIASTLEQYPQARPYFLFNWGRLHSMSASLLYDQWLADHPNRRGADGRKLEEALAELQVAQQLTTYPAATMQHNQDLAHGIQEALRETKEKCFVATAAYGSALAPDVEVLRQFRDTRLRQNRTGRVFIAVYEYFSPPLANAIAPHQSIRWLIRNLILKPIVRLLKSK